MYSAKVNLKIFRTVVKVTVGKSQALYSSMSRRSKDKNSALLTVGAVNIEIPQHPVALHGMMTRGTKQLSSTLQVNYREGEKELGVRECRGFHLGILVFRNYGSLAPRIVLVVGQLWTRWMRLWARNRLRDNRYELVKETRQLSRTLCLPTVARCFSLWLCILPPLFR